MKALVTFLKKKKKKIAFPRDSPAYILGHLVSTHFQPQERLQMDGVDWEISLNYAFWNKRFNGILYIHYAAQVPPLSNFKMFSSTKVKPLTHSVVDSQIPLPSAPENHQIEFCLYGFIYSTYFV